MPLANANLGASLVDRGGGNHLARALRTRPKVYDKRPVRRIKPNNPNRVVVNYCFIVIHALLRRPGGLYLSIALAEYENTTGHLGGRGPRLVLGDSNWPERASLWSVHGQPRARKKGFS